jgi:tetratricopeptide (TPR) repeat protein
LPPELAADYVRTIAQAIHYAHQHGVLHRDLKPSNVLIDALDEPHITDFGLAKRLESVSDLTLPGEVLGTPNYAAPEQAAGRTTSIGPASDVYSLGAILYYALTGRPPFLAETLQETLRQVLDTDPVAPRLLHPKIPRDLETICLKCLTKEPGGRYPDAAKLAEDLERWRAGKPILARPAGRVEKMWRWCRREPALSGLVAAVLALLVTVAIGSSSMFIREKRARENEANLRRQAQAHQQQAQLEAEKSQKVARFLRGTLQDLPSLARGGNAARVQEILSQTAERVARDFTNQPEVEVDLRLTLAGVYHDLGFYQPTEQMARAALSTGRSRLGSGHPSVPSALAQLGDALMHLGKLKESEGYCREALALHLQQAGTNTSETVGFLSTFGNVLQRERKLQEAERVYREALEMAQHAKGENSAELAGLLDNLALVLQGREPLEEAEALTRRGLGMRRKLFGPEHADVATSLHNLAHVLYLEGHLAQAESTYREALAMRRRVLGEEHAAVATSLHNLALVLSAESNPSAAESLYREALAMRQKLLGEQHPTVAETLSGLAEVLRDEGKVEEAGLRAREALVISQKVWPNQPEKWLGGGK